MTLSARNSEMGHRVRDIHIAHRVCDDCRTRREGWEGRGGRKEREREIERNNEREREREREIERKRGRLRERESVCVRERESVRENE